MILLLYHGLNPTAHFPPLSPQEESKDQLCCWTCEKVQQVLTLNGFDDNLSSLLVNISGEVLMWLDLKRKDLDDIGIKSIAEQQKVMTLIKTLVQTDPVASRLRGKQVHPQAPRPQPDLGAPTRGPNGIYVLPYSAVKEACGDFAPVHELGRGGFGVVYRCQLTLSREATAYAVKKLDRSGAQAMVSSRRR